MLAMCTLGTLLHGEEKKPGMNSLSIVAETVHTGQ